MQEQKYQHPILNLETGGTVLVSTRSPQQPSTRKASLVFGSSLLLLGLAGGIAIGSFASERKVTAAESALNLEKLQRQATHKQIEKFCSENLGGNYGR